MFERDFERTWEMEDGLSGLIHLAKTNRGKKYGIDVAPTCDAKYLEVGGYE